MHNILYSGFGRAEGCAVLLLKRYSDAMKDEDNIWGLIRGSAVTQEGENYIHILHKMRNN